MIFQQLFDPTSSTYTYLLAARAGGRAIIIDPVFEHTDTYISLLRRLRLKLAYAMDTHVHADHISGLGALRDQTRCVTVMGEKGGADVVSLRLKEGDPIEAEGVRLQALYTPGHTDDSYCFVMADRAFTGDTLLVGGTGRTDFQNGDSIQAYDSLFSKLLKLPDDTLVYPAHDYNGNTVTTIGWERTHNPRLQVASAQEYAQIMGKLNLPNPRMMDVAIPANRSVGRSLKKYLRPGDDIPAEECLRNYRSSALKFVDLRESSERQRDGTIPGALHMSYGTFDAELAEGSPLRKLAHDHTGQVVLYCAFGERSAMALHAANQAGITGLRHLAGGLAAWLRVGGDVAPARP